MEKIALKENYNSIVFKTRNKFTAMLLFGLKRGYQIIGFEENNSTSDNRIFLKKELRK